MSDVPTERLRPSPESDIGFTSELGLQVEVDGDTLTGRGQVVPELCIPEAGIVRPSVLLSWADILVGSLANERTMPRVCMTVDLDVRVARPLPVGANVVSVGRILKSGRSLTVGEADFFVDGDDAPAAHVIGGFMASPRPDDVGDSFVRRVVGGTQRKMTTPGQPLADLLGATVITPGVVEAERQQRILNWADTVQGGAVALLAEEAVLSLADAVPNELQVRYLRAVRVGPMRATAERFGAWTRVVVTDVGMDDRLVALAVTRP